MIESGRIEVTRNGRVAEIALNRPEKRNALDLDMCQALVAAIEENDADSSVGAIVLFGHGAAFCAGMDLKNSLEVDPVELAAIHERLFTMIRWVRTPIVAVVHGQAVAGGFGLACNAHIIFAGPDARFGLPEIYLGVWPFLIYRAVEEAIGERRTCELSLTGGSFGAEDGKAYGLVSEVLADPLAKARSVAETIASRSTPAIAAGLEYIEKSRRLDWAGAGRVAQEIRVPLMQGEDYHEGVTAFFEKRSPAWPSLR